MANKAPCEMIVWDVLPAIRAAIAQEMVSAGASQLEAARVLGMAPSAVSQYLSGKRGYRIVFDEEVREEIRKLAGELRDGSATDLQKRVCDICVGVRGSGGACRTDDAGKKD